MGIKEKFNNLSLLTKKVIKQQCIVVGAFITFVVGFYFLTIFNFDYNRETFFGQWYWLFMGVITLLLIGYAIFGIIQSTKNKQCLPVKLADKSIKYGFLLKQLVARDFKTKYKRSVLGIFWSFLNPLMMMGVQYLVFSTIFDNASVNQYPTYLLVGVITFAFANEASSSGLSSITSNANLINKVYVPKYIYPISRTISALINFGFSLIPLIIIMLIGQIWPSPYHLLMIPVIFMLIMFVQGLVFLLSTLMVFFRDIQFLWGVFSMAWMYATPIFYSVEFIQNETIRTLLKFNPLYHFLGASRTILIDCVAPDLMAFLYCFIFAVVSLVIGTLVFKWKQKRFVLYV